MLDTDLCDHWVDSPHWHSAERRLWAFYFTFQRSVALHRRFGLYHEALAGVTGLDLVAPQLAHLSVQGIAFDDALAPGELAAMRDAAQRAAAHVAPMQVTLGAAEADRDAIQMPVTPADAIVALKLRLHTAAVAILGPRLHELPMPTQGFAPHISLAYANREVPAAAYAPALRSVPARDIRLTVSKVSLVRLRRGDGAWSWDEEIKFRFGGVSRRRVA